MVARYWLLAVPRVASGWLPKPTVFSCPPAEVTVPLSQAFTRQHRLLTGSHYQAVFDHASWKVGNASFLLMAKASEEPLPRLGLVIGRKRAKRAVDRACIKRRAREQFRLRQQSLHGLDIILLVRGRVDHPDPALVSQQLGQLFDKLLAKCRQA